MMNMPPTPNLTRDSSLNSVSVSPHDADRMGYPVPVKPEDEASLQLQSIAPELLLGTIMPK